MRARRKIRAIRKTLLNMSLSTIDRNSILCQALQYIKIFEVDLKETVNENLTEDLYDICKKFTGLESFKGVECRRIAGVYVAAVTKFGKRKREAGLQKRECDILDAVKGAF